MLILERQILKALADGNPKTCPEIRKFLDDEYHKYMSKQKGKYIVLQDQNIYYNADKLSNRGFITIETKDKKKYYSLKECCIDGELIFRTADNKIKIIECPDLMVCQCPEENGIKKITPKCSQYDIYDRLKVPFTLKF